MKSDELLLRNIIHETLLEKRFRSKRLHEVTEDEFNKWNEIFEKLGVKTVRQLSTVYGLYKKESSINRKETADYLINSFAKSFAKSSSYFTTEEKGDLKKLWSAFVIKKEFTLQELFDKTIGKKGKTKSASQSDPEEKDRPGESEEKKSQTDLDLNDLTKKVQRWFLESVKENRDGSEGDLQRALGQSVSVGEKYGFLLVKPKGSDLPIYVVTLPNQGYSAADVQFLFDDNRSKKSGRAYMQKLPVLKDQWVGESGGGVKTKGELVDTPESLSPEAQEQEPEQTSSSSPAQSPSGQSQTTSQPASGKPDKKDDKDKQGSKKTQAQPGKSSSKPTSPSSAAPSNKEKSEKKSSTEKPESKKEEPKSEKKKEQKPKKLTYKERAKNINVEVNEYRLLRRVIKRFIEIYSEEDRNALKRFGLIERRRFQYNSGILSRIFFG